MISICDYMREEVTVPCFLVFTTPTCGVCKSMHSIFDSVVDKGYRVYEINAEECPDIVHNFGVYKAPTIIYIGNNGVARLEGRVSEKDILDLAIDK